MPHKETQKTVLITGGSGFIGSATCAALNAAGHNVINIDQRRCDVSGVTHYPFDIHSHQIKGILQLTRPETVLFLAPGDDADPNALTAKEHYTQNVADMITLLNHSVTAGVKNFVFGSSHSVYGNTDDSAVKETDVKMPLTPYARSKWMAEMIIDDYATQYDHMRFVCLRYFNVVGADSNTTGVHNINQCTKVIVQLMQAACHDQLMKFQSDGAVDYVHVSDVARAHTAVIDYLDQGGSNETFNLGSGQPVSTFQLAYQIQKQLNMPANATVITPTTVTHNTVADISKATEILGWKPKISFNEIIEQTACFAERMGITK